MGSTFLGIPHIHYDIMATRAPIASDSLLVVLLSLNAHHSMQSKQMNVKTINLDALLNHEVAPDLMHVMITPRVISLRSSMTSNRRLLPETIDKVCTWYILTRTCLGRWLIIAYTTTSTMGLSSACWYILTPRSVPTKTSSSILTYGYNASRASLNRTPP